jgi:hypothetical protein
MLTQETSIRFDHDSIKKIDRRQSLEMAAFIELLIKCKVRLPRKGNLRAGQQLGQKEI